MDDVKPALLKGEARNPQPKVGDNGAADVQGEPVLASLGVKVTWEPSGGASAHGPLMANGIDWEEDDEVMILGPSLGPLVPFLLCPNLGTFKAGTVSYLAPRVSKGGPVPIVLVPGELLPSPQQVNLQHSELKDQFPC